MAVRNPTSVPLGAESVKTGGIEKEAITPAKVLPAILPIGSNAEDTVVVGAAGICRKVVAAVTGNGILKTFVIKHNLETRALVVTFLTETFEEPITMLARSVAINANEIEVTFTLALTAKAINYVVIAG